MRRIRWFDGLTAGFLALCALTLLAPAPTVAAENCIRFDGIDHCPVGNAQLALTPNGSKLIVTGLGAGGNDGVRSMFSDVAFWQADMSAPPASFGEGFSFSAISNGFRTARATLQLDSTEGLLFQIEFTGASGDHPYTLQVINNGFLVAEFEDLNSADTFAAIPYPGPTIPGWPPWPDWPDWPDDDWPPFPGDFGLGTQGECFYGFSFSSPFQVSISNGLAPAVGNEIRIIEEIGAGQYPYASFDGMITRSISNGFAIDSEAVSP